MVTTISQMSLLLLSLYLISSYDCRHHGDDPYPNYGSKRASRFYNEIFLPPAQALRSDRSDYESYVSRGENERVSEITAEAPYEIQGSNERFIAVHSEVWRAKKEDMKRFQDRYRVDETVLRTVSGSIKIVNLPKTYSSLTSKGGQLVKRRPSDDRVVFPAPPVEPMLYVPEIPESCKTMKICDNVINYPRELANKFIAELGDKRDMFNIDKEEDEVEQRNSADQSFRLCSFTEKVVMAPRAAQSLNGDWLFVLNDEDSPLQNYKVEVCKKKGCPCSQNMVHFFKGYNATCHQNYVYQKMVVFNLNSHEEMTVYPELMKVPSGCSCVATKNKK